MEKKIEIYKTYLDKLDNKDPYCILKGIEFYMEFIADCADAMVRDEAFWVFQDFYSDAMGAARNYPAIKEYVDHLNNDRVSSSSITFHTPTVNFPFFRTGGDAYVKDVAMPEQIREILIDNGLHIYQDTGHYYLYIEPDFLLKQFRSYVLSATQEYLKEDSVNDREGFTYDMALTISWKRLGERVIFWDKFLKKYPDFIRKYAAKDALCLYLMVFLRGTDNTRPFDYIDEVRKVYEEYINDYYPEFASAVLIHKYYEVLQRNDFEENDEVMSFLKQIPYGRPERVEWIMQFVKDTYQKV
jgi:hypothetical protein